MKMTNKKTSYVVGLARIIVIIPVFFISNMQLDVFFFQIVIGINETSKYLAQWVEHGKKGIKKICKDAHVSRIL